MVEAISLGAALYVPANRMDLGEICYGRKLAEVRTIILCTEDAIRASEVALGCENIRKALCPSEEKIRKNLFIRVRSPEVLQSILCMPGALSLTGFVLPKVHVGILEKYMRQLHGTKFFIMPTLETRDVFDRDEMFKIVRYLDKDPFREKVPVLRIGGNDLLSLIGMRRPEGRTIYETPIGHVISSLVTIFCPYGFSLSAPVFEYLNDLATLTREVEEDLAHGLVGKTAIHPLQVPQIQFQYRVPAKDIETANLILAQESPAVFGHGDAMCEPATHAAWAKKVLRYAHHYGMSDFSFAQDQKRIIKDGSQCIRNITS